MAEFFINEKKNHNNGRWFAYDFYSSMESKLSFCSWRYSGIHACFYRSRLHYTINQSTSQPVTGFEMGFGTGLNAFFTAIEAEKLQKKIQYVVVEQFPLSTEEALKLNYPTKLHHEDFFNNCINANGIRKKAFPHFLV